MCVHRSFIAFAGFFCCFFFFFFKQKTAYEMRISDWSSDVCSSDLARRGTEEVGDAVVGRLALPRVAEAGQLLGARLVGPDHEVVAVAVGREVPVDHLRHEDAGGLRLGQLLAQLRADAGLEVVVALALLRAELPLVAEQRDRKSTRLNSS